MKQPKRLFPHTTGPASTGEGVMEILFPFLSYVTVVQELPVPSDATSGIDAPTPLAISKARAFAGLGTIKIPKVSAKIPLCARRIE